MDLLRPFGLQPRVGQLGYWKGGFVFGMNAPPVRYRSGVILVRSNKP